MLVKREVITKNIDPLKLDSIKNNSHQIKEGNKLDRCPNPVGYWMGLEQLEQFNRIRKYRGNMRCKSWSCPYCAGVNVKQLRKRIFNSEMVKEAKIAKGFRTKYNQKFLTLTCPGSEFRASYDPLQAYELMSRNYDKLTRALKKRNGDYKFLKVCEPQKDGYPHLHVVMVGQAIAKKEILQEIEELWRYRYGMGFVRLNIVTRSIEHAIRYITKYLTKGMVSMGKKKRVFTASKGGLAPREKREWLETRVFIGAAKTGTDGETVIEEYEVDMGCPDAVLKILDYMSTDCRRDVLGFDAYTKKVRKFYGMD